MKYAGRLPHYYCNNACNCMPGDAMLLIVLWGNLRELKKVLRILRVEQASRLFDSQPRLAVLH